jgi:hypothetical protein
VGLRAGQEAWEEISIFCHCREFSTDSHQDIGLVTTLIELIRLLIIRVEVNFSAATQLKNVAPE